VKRYSRPAAHARLVTEPNTYAIEVQGNLPSALLTKLADFTVVHRERSTVLTGCVADAAALYGILARLECFGVPLVSVRPITEHTEKY
jgi:hypothetical protein